MWRDKHAELLRENKRLVKELEDQKNIMMSYVDELENASTANFSILMQVKGLENQLSQRDKLHEYYKDEFYVQWEEWCYTDYDRHKERQLRKALEWYIRRLEGDHTEILGLCDEHESN